MGLRKLRNLKFAATRPNVPFGTGGHKSLNLKDVIFNKASDWEYEGEYRIVIDIPDGDDSKRNVKWEHFMVFDSIYLGYEMPEHHRDAVNNLFKSDSNIKIIEMEQVPGQLQVKPKDL